jgi:hypothetical protein
MGIGRKFVSGALFIIGSLFVILATVMLACTQPIWTIVFFVTAFFFVWFGIEIHNEVL